MFGGLSFQKEYTKFNKTQFLNLFNILVGDSPAWYNKSPLSNSKELQLLKKNMNFSQDDKLAQLLTRQVYPRKLAVVISTSSKQNFTI